MTSPVLSNPASVSAFLMGSAPSKWTHAMDTARSHPSSENLSRHASQSILPSPSPPTSAPMATESTNPILVPVETQSLSGVSGNASSSGSPSGPNSLQMANPLGTPSTSDTRQNCPGSPKTSRKSASEM